MRPFFEENIPYATIGVHSNGVLKSLPEKQKPRGLFPSAGLLFWRRPIDSLIPTRSPFGLPVYVARLPAAPFSARVGDVQNKTPSTFSHAGRLVLATSYSRTTYRRTTIGAAAFHFRVRNGNGWCHCAMITRVRNRTGISILRIEAFRSRPLAVANLLKNRAADSLISTYRKCSAFKASFSLII
jgi:hypothetical protein